MDIQLKTGDGYQDLYIPDDNLLDVLLPANVMPIDDKNERQIINDALDAPYGSKKLEELVKPGDKIAVITSDNTRPFPSKRVLPVLIELLEKKGILCEDIIVVIALGSHRPLSEEEKCSLIGEAIYEKVICINSGEHGFCHAGVTSRGTPVDIDSCVFSADVIPSPVPSPRLIRYSST